MTSPATPFALRRSEYRASQRVFFPASKVLQERRLITFDSDDEDGDVSCARPKLSEPDEDEGDREGSYTTAFDLAGRVEHADIGLNREQWSAALSSIPRDAWTSLLSDDDRRMLSAYLPHLDGWNEYTGEEAQRQNVEALLSGEIFHFSNPMEELEKKIRTGRCSVMATMTRLDENRHGRMRFDLNRLMIARSRIEDIKRKVQESSDTSRSDDAPPRKRIRVRGEPNYIYSTSDSSGISENSSLFLAIRSTLKHKSATIQEIVEVIMEKYPEVCKRVQRGVPSFFSFNKYVRVVLAFLHEAISPGKNGSCQPLVVHDQEHDMFSWFHEDETSSNKDWKRSLVVLERVFRASIPDNLVATGNSFDLKWSQRHYYQTLMQQAADELRSSDPSFAFFDAYTTSRPSNTLKHSLVVGIESGASHVDDFRHQEAWRYRHPQVPFVYVGPKNHTRVTVGPVFTEPLLTRMEELLLVPHARSSSVNLVTLVYDACATLRGGSGTRADIRANLLRTQFIRSDAEVVTVDKAIVAALNVLERIPPRGSSTPCIRFNGDEARWVYTHAADEWSTATEAPAFEEKPEAPVTPSKMSLKELLH